jgi:hypothetical protein
LVLKAAVARHGPEEVMTEFAARINPDVLQSYKDDIEEREKFMSKRCSASNSLPLR